LIQKSLNFLIHLKKPNKIDQAINSKILEILTFLLNDFSSFIHNEIAQSTLQLLEILSVNFHAAIATAGNDLLMKTLVNLSLTDKKLKPSASKVLLSLSSIPSGLSANLIANFN
jgi:hypothetical protein